MQSFIGTEADLLAPASWANDAPVGIVVVRWHWIAANLGDENPEPRELAIVLDALARQRVFWDMRLRRAETIDSRRLACLPSEYRQPMEA